MSSTSSPGCVRRASGRTARYLWTDAFGVVLLVSLYAASEERKYLDEAEWVVAEVDRVLGRPRGIRIGEAPDRDGQYFHYLAMWLYALSILGRHLPDYRRKGVELVRQIHDSFVVPNRGVVWKMNEDLSAPYPGYGFGALDAFDGYVSYRLLDEKALSREIADMRRLIDRSAPDLHITQDLGLGMMLWMSQFFPDEDWARAQKARCLGMLDRMWVEDGYFCREPGLHQGQICFHQLWGVGRVAGSECDARASTEAQCIFRDLPFGRRIRSGSHYPCHGLQLAFSGLSHSRLWLIGTALAQ